MWAFVVTPGNDEPLRRPPGVLGVLGGDALLGPGAAPDDLRQDAASTEKKSSRYKQTGSLLRGGRGLGRRDDRGEEVEGRGASGRCPGAALPARTATIQTPRVDDVAAGQGVEQL